MIFTRNDFNFNIDVKYNNIFMKMQKIVDYMIFLIRNYYFKGMKLKFQYYFRFLKCIRDDIV